MSLLHELLDIERQKFVNNVSEVIAAYPDAGHSILNESIVWLWEDVSTCLANLLSKKETGE